MMFANIENDMKALEHFADLLKRQADWARFEGWTHTNEALRDASERLYRELGRLQEAKEEGK